MNQTSVNISKKTAVRKKKKKVAVFSNIALLVFSALCIIPFVSLFSISISNEADIVKTGYSLIPKHIDFSAYKYILREPTELLNAYGVTIFTTAVGTFLSVLVMAMIAYPLSRKDYVHRNGLSFFVFFTMLFSGGMVPTYILITQYLNMQDNIWVLIIPGLVNAWYIILLRTFFQTLHGALIESARIDGASEFRIFGSIVLPLSKPALATVALFGILLRWNDWLNCMLYISNEKLYTLQYLLQRIMFNIELLKNMGSMSTLLAADIDVPSETMRMAMAVLVVGPIILVFPFFQKYFEKGVIVGGVKG